MQVIVKISQKKKKNSLVDNDILFLYYQHIYNH